MQPKMDTAFHQEPTLQPRLTFSPRQQQQQQLPLPLRRHHRPPRRERIVSASFARRSAWSKTLLRYSAELPVGSIVFFLLAWCFDERSTAFCGRLMRSAEVVDGLSLTHHTHLWREASFGSGGQADFFVSVQFSTIIYPLFSVPEAGYFLARGIIIANRLWAKSRSEAIWSKR